MKSRGGDNGNYCGRSHLKLVYCYLEPQIFKGCLVLILDTSLYLAGLKISQWLHSDLVLFTLLVSVPLLTAEVITYDYPLTAMVSTSLIPISPLDDINYGACAKMCREDEGGLGAIKKTLETHG